MTTPYQRPEFGDPDWYEEINTYFDSVEDAIAAIPAGPTGATGPQGQQGVQGIQGIQGEPGLKYR